MTMTKRSEYFREEPWTVDDLYDLPDDGMRHELVDGRLVMSPQAARPHYRLVTRLQRLLIRQAPAGIEVGQNAGVEIGTHTYLVPDLLLTHAAVLESGPHNLVPEELLLVVEVLSPSNKAHDLVMKRHLYATAGIPQYWIIDEHPASMTVLRLDGKTYAESAVLKPDDTFETDEPFPLRLVISEVF
jgi:Uma2 family endonuclease